MTKIGKEIRLRRIIGIEGKTVIVPMDHGIEAYFKELENPNELVAEIVKGGADALLMRRGLVKKTYNLITGKVGLIYRVSGATGTSPDVSDQRLLSTVTEALKFGADAVVFTIVVGHPHENDMLQVYGTLSDLAEDWGMPLIGEVDTWEKASGDKWELLRQGVRVVSEEGADLVKSYFPPETEHFRDIIRYSLVPVVAAGGPKFNNPRDFLTFVRNVMDAGAIGVATGRNIWQYENPRKMVEAVSSIVKQGKSVEDALKVLQG